MKVVFIAAPYRASTEWGVEENIQRAEKVALDVWSLGMAAFCPHKNTAHFGGALPDSVWLTGGQDMLRKCDAVLVVALSPGVIEEIDVAKRTGIPVFDDITQLHNWSLGLAHRAVSKPESVNTECAVPAQRHLRTTSQALEQELRLVRGENQELRNALKWCSGATVFMDGGEARAGYLSIVRPLLDRPPA